MVLLQGCDVVNTSKHTCVMAAEEDSSTSATYCAAGNPNKTNCGNKTGMPGISMHYFPKEEISRQKWTRFVRIHRKDFHPKAQSALCSAHFDESCFVVVGIPVYDESGKLVKPPRRTLIPGSLPSKDSLTLCTSPLTSRKRRGVSMKLFYKLIIFPFDSLRVKTCLF